MPVTFQQLEIFRAVARHLSFSVAAQEIYTSQPHVSNQIRKLEEHYRVPLFIRSHPGITLTEAGVALYERVSRILDDLDEAEQIVQEFRGLHRGTVKLAATESAGNHVVPGLAAAFRQSYPEIVVRMRVGNTEDVLTWLENDEAELGICPRRPESRFLTSEPFYEEPLVVIHPADMGLQDPLPVRDFATLPLVIREDGSLTQTKTFELLAGAPVRMVAQLGGPAAVNEAVAAGLGVSLVPERSAQAWVEAGSVGTVRLADADPRHTFFLVFSQQRYVTPATRALIDHLRAAASHQGRVDRNTT